MAVWPQCLWMEVIGVLVCVPLAQESKHPHLRGVDTGLRVGQCSSGSRPTLGAETWAPVGKSGQADTHLGRHLSCCPQPLDRGMYCGALACCSTSSVARSLSAARGLDQGSQGPSQLPSSLGLLNFLLPLPSLIPNEQLVCRPAWHQLSIPRAKSAEPAVCERDTVWLRGRQAGSC